MSAPTAEDRKRLAEIEARIYGGGGLCWDDRRWLIARLKEAWAQPRACRHECVECVSDDGRASA